MNYKGNLIDLNEKVVMSIVNITTNSFYDGGKYLEEDALIATTSNHITAGATIIDLGACSTRPLSIPVTEEEEIEAIKKGVTILKKHFPEITLSIDTFRHKVAEAAVDIWGEVIVNDVYGGDYDKEMVNFVAANGLPYVAMHQSDIKGDTVNSIIDYFSRKINEAERKGIKDYIIDVGFGFNKSLEQNYEILNNYEKFKILERPSLVGISRKSMIWRTLENTPQEALNGTTALNTLLLYKGADILRVHDTTEAIEVIKLVKQCHNMI